VNVALKELFLASNNIGDKGSAALAEALKANSTLEQLYLANNTIGDEGATALAEALNSNSTIQKLGLEDNKNMSQTLHRQIESQLSPANRDRRHNNQADGTQISPF